MASVTSTHAKPRRNSEAIKDVHGYKKYRMIKSGVRIPDLRFTPTWSTVGIIFETSDAAYERLKPRERFINDQKMVAKNAINVAIKNIEIVSSLPILLQDNCKRLKRYFKKEDVEFISRVCDKFSSFTSFSTWIIPSRHNVPFINQNTAGTQRQSFTATGFTAKELSISSVMSEVVQMITKNECLITQRQQAFPYIHKNSFVLLTCMHDILDIMDYNFSISSTDERKHIIDYEIALQQHSSLEQEIKSLSEKMVEKKNTHAMEIADGKKNLESLIEHKSYLQRQATEVVADYIKEREVTLLEDVHESRDNQKELAKVTEVSTRNYDGLLKNDLKREEGLKKKCSKVESLLANWVNLYDTDVGKKRMEYEVLRDRLESLFQEFNSWNDALAEQMKVYEVLFEEYEQEERERFEVIAYQFLMNRSAARIQRYYREYRRLKKEKKKGKKKGGKKKGKRSPSEVKVTATDYKGADLSANLEKKFGGEVFESLDPNVTFETTEKVEL